MTRQPAQCGTPSGYNRHKRDGEEACEDCRKAHTDTNRKTSAARSWALTQTAHEHPGTYRKFYDWALRDQP